ncbi:alpha/beta fold hydrolase [Paenibacillus sp. Leaf72]|uniref:alpha/beta fold hydrolase n=1 Tax=Paenibacillus sp. Leaf72 TaxID=1736234 RepID=UPI0009D6FE5B|nr:alpha/beta fold hydrolase [Paenibacillus sp. Leaf72]
MKKHLASTIVFSLLLMAAFPAMTAAAETLKLLVNGKVITTSNDNQPYTSKNAVMIPLRGAAEGLGLKVSYNKASSNVLLEGQDLKVTFSSGSSEALVNGEKRTFDTASVQRQGRLYVPLAFFSKALGYQAGYDSTKKEIAIASPLYEAESWINRVISLLNKGDYQKLSDDYFSNNLKAQVSVEALGSVWKSTTAQADSFVRAEEIAAASDDSGMTIITATAVFKKTSFNFTLYVNTKSGLLEGMLITPKPIDKEAPATIVEEEVTVGEGTPYALGGTLTLPKNATGPLTAVVLVQGSGASDRDETVSGYTPFRDIAWGLAEQGIAVLRYDKRTFVYGSSMTTEAFMKMTVKEETIDDAIVAAKLLKADKRIDASKVYVIGHSLGGMLAPRIDAEGGDFAGLVLLAGSPRSLWEIVYDQNQAFIAAMDDKDPAKAANAQLIEAEYKKAQALGTLTDAQAQATTVFSLPAYYFKEMDNHPASGYAAKLTKPVLVLQGKDDFQVFANKDYVLWEELFKGKSNASFKLYPGLNHFFVDYSGEGEGTLAEYNHPGSFAEPVISDIAKWLKQHA